MTFPRITATIFTLLLIGSLSLIAIVGVNWIGPMLAHGNNVQHASGKIITIGPGRDFMLRTPQGEKISFLCGHQCRASLGHMLRHQIEGANTDIYYILGPNNTLLAIDVD